MKSDNKWLYGIGIFTIIFLVVSIVFRTLQLEELPIQITGTLFGVVVTAIITVFLLNGQSASEEKRDKSLLVFEKKQEVYHNFLNNLKKIIMDGEITIAAQNGKAEEMIDELKDLLFELGYVQLHTSEKNTKAIFEKVTNIIQVLNDFEQEGINKQKVLPQFYTQIATHLFDIIAILKEDLYGKLSQTINPESITELLESCDLFVDTEEVDRYELQNYFWNTLQDELIKRNYLIERKDFSFEVNQYYARSRNRHRYYGIEFPIHKFADDKIVNFRLEIENELYYGFHKQDETEQNSVVEQSLKRIKGFQNSPRWFGWKWFDRNKLDFWLMDSPAIILLKNPRKRDRLIKDIADEIDMYIKQLQFRLNEVEEENESKV
ncbi:hypothetical protein NYR30_12975 [Gallibacterium salpingitidis]|uniref:hypothetical protein n=1 Tax=Gallibacterium salpingitidis TaxID=505341 RepID=UPI00266FF9DD|nr:hypothetical protein [Gallibacterium salpingitidis]WKS99599.1 hypothetical protein NYR30_12975 [Gallibacterium salpingitidis]